MPTRPSGGKLGESNALSPSAETLTDRHPRSSFSPKQRHTSGMSSAAAISKLVNVFARVVPDLTERDLRACHYDGLLQSL